MAGQDESEQGRTPQVIVTEVFDALWIELKKPLGSAAAAAILRRAAAASQGSCPALSRIRIRVDGRDYVYEALEDDVESCKPCEDLGPFVDNVLSLVQELTGNVLVVHLLSNPVIRKHSSEG